MMSTPVWNEEEMKLFAGSVKTRNMVVPMKPFQLVKTLNTLIVKCREHLRPQ